MKNHHKLFIHILGIIIFLWCIPIIHNVLAASIAYPIVELGNCDSLTNCHTYCEDPTHWDTCRQYGETKGLYRVKTNAFVAEIQEILPAIRQKTGCTTLESCDMACRASSQSIAECKRLVYDGTGVSDPNSLMAKASIELGCNSPLSCQITCSDAQNFQRCDAFARKWDTGGGFSKINTSVVAQIVSKVTTNRSGVFCSPYSSTSNCFNQTTCPSGTCLPCNPKTDSCKTYCDIPVNYERCGTFAKSHGLIGGTRAMGPNGCTSIDSCQSYCHDPGNFSECKAFWESGQSGSFKGPGGCKTEDTCWDYCEKNPSACTSNNYFTHQAPDEETIKSYKQSCNMDELNNELCEQIPWNMDAYQSYCQENSSNCSYLKYCSAEANNCIPRLNGIPPQFGIRLPNGTLVLNGVPVGNGTALQNGIPFQNGSLLPNGTLLNRTTTSPSGNGPNWNGINWNAVNAAIRAQSAEFTHPPTPIITSSSPAYIPPISPTRASSPYAYPTGSSNSGWMPPTATPVHYPTYSTYPTLHPTTIPYPSHTLPASPPQGSSSTDQPSPTLPPTNVQGVSTDKSFWQIIWESFIRL